MSLLVSCFPPGKKDRAGIEPADSKPHRQQKQSAVYVFRVTTSQPMPPILAVSPAVTALTCLSATLDGSPAKGSGRFCPCCHRFRLIVLAFDQPQDLRPTHDCRLSATDPGTLCLGGWCHAPPVCKTLSTLAPKRQHKSCWFFRLYCNAIRNPNENQGKNNSEKFGCIAEFVLTNWIG